MTSRSTVAAAARWRRPSTFDPVAYKNRNVVERSFALLKQWRGLATRFDKLAIVYRSTAVLGRSADLGSNLTDRH